MKSVRALVLLSLQHVVWFSLAADRVVDAIAGTQPAFAVTTSAPIPGQALRNARKSGSYCVTWPEDDRSQGRLYTYEEEARNTFSELYGAHAAVRMYGPGGKLMGEFGYVDSSDWQMKRDWCSSLLHRGAQFFTHPHLQAVTLSCTRKGSLRKRFVEVGVAVFTLCLWHDGC